MLDANFSDDPLGDSTFTDKIPLSRISMKTYGKFSFVPLGPMGKNFYSHVQNSNLLHLFFLEIFWGSQPRMFLHSSF